MSGLCGWFSSAPPALPISQMAVPLWRKDNVPLRTGAHGKGALALAAHPDGGRLWQEDGLLVAVWGERAEPLARLWRSHGVKACAAFSGNYAFAIIDAERDEALLAVDRLGTHPMFYQQLERGLVFASSAEALARHPGCGSEIAPQALFDFLMRSETGCVYQGHQPLGGGEYLHVRAGRSERGRHWRLQCQASQSTAQQCKQELIDTLRSAVASLLTERPVGVLSGRDPACAAVGALLVDSGARPRTYTGEMSASDFADAIPRIASSCDQPLADWSAFTAFYAADRARGDGVGRLLCANGAAELFGWRRRPHLRHYEQLPSALRQMVIEPLLFQVLGGVRPLQGARDAIEEAVRPLPPRLATPCALLDPSFRNAVDAHGPQAARDQAWWLASGGQSEQQSALDLRFDCIGRQLPAIRQGCELAGVEAVFPFLNDAVVAFAARLPAQYKSAAFFRDAMLAVVPRGALAPAPASPFSHWLRTDARLRTLAYDSLSALAARRILRADVIDQLLANGATGHDEMVWALMMLEQWLGARRPAATAPPSTLRHEHIAGHS